jgi:hypothetical protein
MDATTATTTPATPKKLRDGSWGALVQTATVKSGDAVKITTKAGKSWTTTVYKVLWSGDGKAICSTNSGGGGVRDGFCEECGKESFDLKAATDSSGIGGYVCGRCYGPPEMLSFA